MTVPEAAAADKTDSLEAPRRGRYTRPMSMIPPRALGLCAALLASPLCGAYTPDPPPLIEVSDTQTTGSARLILETNPSGADIYLDQVFIGRAPHDQQGVAPEIGRASCRERV